MAPNALLLSAVNTACHHVAVRQLCQFTWRPGHTFFDRNVVERKTQRPIGPIAQGGRD